jgi:hypothetical protein
MTSPDATVFGEPDTGPAMEKRRRSDRREDSTGEGMQSPSSLFLNVSFAIFLCLCTVFTPHHGRLYAADSPPVGQRMPVPVSQGPSNPARQTMSKTTTSVALTGEERSWLRSHPVIRVVQDPGWPPVEFLDEEGEYVGISGDYLKIIEGRLGVSSLVSNAMKHAFPEGRKGTIAISMREGAGADVPKPDTPPAREGSRIFVLSVSDDGIGFPEDLDFRHSPSLGMQLVIELVRQIDGEIRLTRGAGTQFEITFSDG